MSTRVISGTIDLTRNTGIHISTSSPTSSDGKNGDIWFVRYPSFLLNNGTASQAFQYELNMTWETFINSVYNNNNFTINSNTNEVLWSATNTRIFIEGNSPNYIVKTNTIQEKTYCIEST